MLTAVATQYFHPVDKDRSATITNEIKEMQDLSAAHPIIVAAAGSKETASLTSGVMTMSICIKSFRQNKNFSKLIINSKKNRG